MSQSARIAMELDDSDSEKAEQIEFYDGDGDDDTEEATPPIDSNTAGSRNGGASGRQKKQYAVSTRWEREVAEHGLPNDYNRYMCCCAKRLGNMFVILAWPDGSPIVIAGPCWPFCMGVTLPLVLLISGLVIYFLIIDDDALPDWVGYIYYVVVGLVLSALFCVGCRDPGLMERVTDEEAGEGGWYWNEQVGSFRPPGALYCRECGVMIQDYDHLCPWTGTGIGGRNMFFFKAFVVMVNILCYFSIVLVAWVLLSGLAN